MFEHFNLQNVILSIYDDFSSFFQRIPTDGSINVDMLITNNRAIHHHPQPSSSLSFIIAFGEREASRDTARRKLFWRRWIGPAFASKRRSRKSNTYFATSLQETSCSASRLGGEVSLESCTAPYTLTYIIITTKQ